MTNEEYQSCVKYVQEHYFNIPDFLIGDQTNWRNRSMLARALIRTEKYEQSIQLFKTVVSIEPHIEFVSEPSLSEVEDKVICLISLSLLIQLNESYDRNQVKKYLGEAKFYTERYSEYFEFSDIVKTQQQIEIAMERIEEII